MFDKMSETLYVGADFCFRTDRSIGQCGPYLKPNPSFNNFACFEIHIIVTDFFPRIVTAFVWGILCSNFDLINNKD